MIHISNLRKESQDGWTKLIADITQLGGQNYLAEPVIWFAVKNENAHMLSDDVYDAFVLVPLYMAMFYKEDLHIHGCVSKRLYKNVMNYLQRILCDFSDDLSRVNVHVDGFKESEGEHNIIGAGISCGVDSLTTIYGFMTDMFMKMTRIIESMRFSFSIAGHTDSSTKNQGSFTLTDTI